MPIELTDDEEYGVPLLWYVAFIILLGIDFVFSMAYANVFFGGIYP